MKMRIPPHIQMVLDRLNEQGYDAFVVGGCVRDALLGKQADDWDVCTSALPKQIVSCFSDMRTVPTGIEHGTITVIPGNEPIEITTFRIDGSYMDGRHPETVTYTTSIAEDLSRRDFTVNAMAYHPIVGLVDPFGGQDDIGRKVIRCVGDPDTRFQEDALRILRGMRFASVLGFSIEDKTRLAMENNAALLTNIAVERIYAECSKLICGVNASQILMKNQAVLSYVLPQYKPDEALYDAFPLLPCDVICRYGAVYRNDTNAGICMEMLRAPKYVRDGVDRLVNAIQNDLPTDLPSTRLWLGKLGEETATFALQINKAFGGAVESVENYLSFIHENGLCCSVRELAVTGEDLLTLGILPGKQIGLLLTELLYAVAHEQVDNVKEHLLSYAMTRL